MFKKIVMVALFATTLFSAELHWAKNYQEGMLVASKEHKPVLFIISSHKCKYCILLDNTTLKDPKVVAKLNKDFVAIRSWTDRGDYIPEMIRYNTPGLPGIWFLDDTGEPLFQPLLGYVKKDAFAKALDVVEAAYKEKKKSIKTEKKGSK